MHAAFGVLLTARDPFLARQGMNCLFQLHATFSVPGEAVLSLGLTDITQAAVLKNFLLFMNQSCLYNVVVDSPGFAPQCCLHMLLLFALP